MIAGWVVLLSPVHNEPSPIFAAVDVLEHVSLPPETRLAVHAAAPAPRVLQKRLQSIHALSGIASWYGSVLDGHTTASGEIFHMENLTACHRTLPFGTWVRVIAVSTGKSVVVKINDRGVLYADRVIDLSLGAARTLGIVKTGTAEVRLEVLKGKPETASAEATTESATPFF